MANEFSEDIDLTLEPWKTLAIACWNSPSPYRLGQQAELKGVSGNPFKKPKTREIFENGRNVIKKDPS